MPAGSSIPNCVSSTCSSCDWLRTSGADTLLHGHTHRPGRHELGDGLQRLVLGDWDTEAKPPRAEVLRLDASGWRRIALAG